jgi:hypothetical protein
MIVPILGLMTLHAGESAAGSTCRVKKGDTGRIISKPAIAFVLPSRAIGDPATRAGISEEIARSVEDQELLDQFLRLRERALENGVEPLRCSSAEARFEFRQPDGKKIRVDLGSQPEWAGTVFFCPGHEPVVSRERLTDTALLEQFVGCGARSKRGE